MNKRWYPVAITMSLVGCGGDVDNAKPAASGTGGSSGVDAGLPSETGGMPKGYYGVILATGGQSSVDTGVPFATGGATPIPPYGVIPAFGGTGYGGSPVYGAIQPTGGAKAGFGGGSTAPKSSGGVTHIDTGTPAASGGGYSVDYGVLPSPGGRPNS